MKYYILAVVGCLLLFSEVSQAAIQINVASNDTKANYTPGEVITLEMTSVELLSALSFTLNSSEGGTASSPQIQNINFQNAFQANGSVENNGTILISNVVGIISTVGEVPAAGLQWTVEYQVPTLPPLTTIRLFVTNNNSLDDTSTLVTIEDLEITIEDASAPTPNPATFDTSPTANDSSSISMTATTGTDISTPVEYNFDETSDNSGSTDSGWQTSTDYTDDGLSSSTQYCYTVQLRDALANTGTASSQACATTAAPDLTPPSPNPATFSIPPTADSVSAISMTATTATDPATPIEYDFNETSGNSGASNSGWSTSTSFVDDGLTNSTQYCYTLQSRDGLGNTGTASNPACATTLTPDTTPPTPNPATFSIPPSADSDTAISMTATTATDASGPVEYLFTETTGNSGGSSSSWSTAFSFGDDGLSNGTEYCYTVQFRDSEGNTTTPSSQACATTTSIDLDPPTPDPAEFTTAPFANSDSSISMVSLGTDISGPVEYNFVETTGNPGATNSDWTTFSNYSDNGLSSSTTYCYTVQTRDATGNTGTASAAACATTDDPPDTTAPTPNPATFETAPNAISETTISMTATTASDDSGPLQYFFTETSGNTGGSNSSWQTSTNYLDQGLESLTQYCYTVQSRDSEGNATTASSTSCATTQAPSDTTPPTPNPMTFDTPTVISHDAIAIMATTANDLSGPVEYEFIEVSGNPGGSNSDWQTSTVYTDIELDELTEYCYQVRARDSAGVPNIGDYSESLCLTTIEFIDPNNPDPNAPNEEPNEPEIIPQNITITKLSIKAGKDRTSQNPGDDISISGQLYDNINDSSPSDLLPADTISIRITTLDEFDNEVSVIFFEEFDITLDLGKLTKTFKFSYKSPDLLTSNVATLTLDFKKNSYDISIKDINLAGFQLPFKLELDFGTYAGIMIYDSLEDINAKNLLPLCLLSGVFDALDITNAKVKSSKKGDSLNAKGEITSSLANLDLTTEEITISWIGNNTFSETLPAGSFTTKKTGIFNYKKPKKSNGDIQSITIDLNKCTFKLTIKNADQLDAIGTITLRLNTTSNNFDASDSITLD